MADYPARGHWSPIQVFLPVVCVFVSACSTSHRIEDRIFIDGPQGTVSLQSVSDTAFRTTHPVSVSPLLLTHILRGTQALPDDITTAMHVFSDNETRFLAPLISKALTTATENQLVTFRVLRGKSSEKESIGGIIYIHGRLLHLTLTAHHPSHDGEDSGQGQGRMSRHPGELDRSELVFIPETGLRSNLNEEPHLATRPPLGRLVIDYRMFNDTPDPSLPTAQSQSLHMGSLPCTQADVPSTLGDDSVTALEDTASDGAGETQAFKELLCDQAMEIDALKKDMRVLRHMLSEIEARKKKSIKQEVPHIPLRRTLNMRQYFNR